MDDKLLILEDNNRDGRADACKVFAGGLHQPTGFEIGRGGVYVAQQPDILFLRDIDGDDREDERTRQLFGFDRRRLASWIGRIPVGTRWRIVLSGRDLQVLQVESPYGLNRMAEAGIWRYDPRTEKFSVFTSFAFANPWGHVFDRWGQDFIGDASPGFSYWAAPIRAVSTIRSSILAAANIVVLPNHRRGSRISIPTLYPKRTRPLAGCELVSSRHFLKRFKKFSCHQLYR